MGDFFNPDNPLLYLFAGVIVLAVYQRRRLYAFVSRGAGQLGAMRWPAPRDTRVQPMISHKPPAPPELAPAPRPARAPRDVLVPGAAPALRTPPEFERTMQAMEFYEGRSAKATGHRAEYLFPVGWYLSPNYRAALIWCSFLGDVNHIAVSGKTDSGKDGVLRLIALSLALTYEPSEVQFAIIDGSRGVDWGVWADRAHTWLYVAHKEGDESSEAMIDAFTTRLDQTLDDRAEQIRAAGVDKWDQLPKATRPPMLVILVTELGILQFRLGRRFDAWLSARLQDGRKFGVRFVLQTQSFSGGGEYRKQISLYIAGHQTSRYDDEPNTGMSTADLSAAGAIPPSKLPPVPEWAGVFTVVQGRDAQTLRAPYLPTATMRELVASLPAGAGQVEAPAQPASSPAPEPVGALVELAAAMPELLVSPGTGKTIKWSQEHAIMAAFLTMAALKGRRAADFQRIELQRILYPEQTDKGQRGSYGTKAVRIAGEVSPIVAEVLRRVQGQAIVEKAPESELDVAA